VVNQLLGIEVDAINSVQFSNHTGYASFRGTKLGGTELSDIFDGLQANGLTRYSHLLTGYVGLVGAPARDRDRGCC
jgi:pyridoxine kinase